MHVTLHKNARTTPAIRRELRQSTAPTKQLAREYGLNAATVRKWRERDSTDDRSHRPHTIHATLTPAQEAVAVALRTTLLLPLDDLLAVVREFLNPNVSRSGLDRCLRRHGASDLAALKPKEDATAAPKKSFKDDVPGFVHADVKYLPRMPGEPQARYLFVAIDRATRWVYLEVLPRKSASCAAAFLRRAIAAAPFAITKILTDNGKEFTDRFCATGERDPTGRHRFDMACANAGIEHRLIRPRHPQTNGMVERFNGRISEVLATTRFDSALNLEQTLIHYCRLYNHSIPQKALGHIPPIQALKNWQETHPHLFKKKIYNLSGLGIT